MKRFLEFTQEFVGWNFEHADGVLRLAVLIIVIGVNILLAFGAI